MISAVVLAAGQSKRMGTPKMVLPWKQTTIIGQVVSTLWQGGVEDIVIVTGGAHELVEQVLQDLPVRTIFNPRFAESEMLESLQVGLSALSEESAAALVALGDQPQIERGVVESVIATYHATLAPLVVPSYQMRRGHPWLVDRSLWQAVLQTHFPATLHDFLIDKAEFIHYITVDTNTILQDMDTPDEYLRYRTSSD